MGVDTDIVKTRRAPTLVGIMLFKLGKGVFFLLVALGIYTLSDNNLPDEFRSLVRWFHFNPEKEFFLSVFRQLEKITETNMLWVAGGTLAYAALALVEGIGLWLWYRWAANLAILESAFFIPYEIYKLSHKLSAGMAALLVVNITIVWYLWANRERLFRHHHHHAAPPAKPQN